MIPVGYRQIGVSRRRFGSLTFATHDDPAVFWIVARGFITPSLIREELPIVESFAQVYPGGWTYVVDTSHVGFVHPWNPVLLRRIRLMPHIRSYIIIANPLVGMLGRIVSWMIRPSHIVRTAEEAFRCIDANEDTI